MSGLPVIACEGAPRALGLDQGAACAEAIRARVARAGGRRAGLGRWRPFEPGALARARATARDVRRHFPHLDERVIGLARGARVPELALHHLLARELGPEGEGASLGAGSDAEGRIVLHPALRGILRRSQPDTGFSSAEWTLPWLPGALAGVNRAGLAGAVAPAGGDGADGFAAPAFLLLQNCLQQFETVENAIEWCERRPAGGQARLVFADPTGARAQVVLEESKRFRAEIAPAAPEPSTGCIVADAAAGLLRTLGADGEKALSPPADR